MKRRLPCLLLCLLAFTAACDRAEEFERPLDPQGPLALRSHVAWLVPAYPSVARFDPKSGALQLIALDETPTSAHLAPEAAGLLVLADGLATWIPDDGTPVDYPVAGAFSRATFSPEGGRVVLHHGGGGGGALTNPNQIAVLDLGAPPGDDNPVHRTLRSFGAVPSAIVVGPRAEVAGANRQLAWVLAERYLSLLDLAAPAAREVVVHLTLAGDPRPVTPTQIVMTTEGQPTAFVRAGGSDDVFSLTFPDDAPADEVPRPYLNQLPAGAAPTDLVVEPVQDGLRVFTISEQTATISVIDPGTAQRIGVEVGQAVRHLLPFTAPRPDDGGAGRFALLWGPNSGAVVFADLDQLAHRRGRALTPLPIQGRVQSVHPLPGRRGAVARFADRIALLDFDDRTVTPLTAGGEVTALVVDPSGNRVYVGVAGTVFSVVSVDVATGAPVATEIPAGRGPLVYVPEAQRLLVDHGAASGYVSILDPDDLDDGRVSERTGLFLQGVLDR